jgi:hypothetical protein
LAACTAILGDFSVGTNDGGSDSGVDGPADAAPDVLATIESCAEVANVRRPITTGASLHASNVHMFGVGNGNARVVLANYIPNDAGPASAELRAYTFDPKNLTSSVDEQTLPLAGYNVVAITRYPGSPGGFAALWLQYDVNQATNFLWAARIQDDGSAWSNPVKLSNVGSSFDDLEASFTALDAQNDSYYIVYSSVTSNTQTITAGTASTTSGPLTAAATFPVQNENAYDLIEPGIALAGNQPFVIVNTDTNGPPTPGLQELLLVPTKATVAYTPPTNLNYIPIAMANGADPLSANVAILEADLTHETATYHVGKMPFSSMGTFDPSTLPASTPPPGDDSNFSKLSNITFGSSLHWEATSAGEQALISSPTADPLLQKVYGGLNFGWWDGATGTLRAYNGGTHHLLGDVPNMLECNTTFTSLGGNLAQIGVAYLSTSQTPQPSVPPQASDLWVTQIGCQ